jgi:hypothetical protein
MINVYWMNHRTNLVIQSLFQMSIVKNIEDVLQSLYVYIFHSPKITQEFVDLVDNVEIKSKQILKTIKTHWILWYF